MPTQTQDGDDGVRERTTDITEWDQHFFCVTQEMLFEIILAANYLDIKPLLCATNSVVTMLLALLVLAYFTAMWDAKLLPT